MAMYGGASHFTRMDIPSLAETHRRSTRPAGGGGYMPRGGGWGSQAGNGATGFPSLMGQFEEKSEQARKANIKRYKEAMSIYDKIIARSQPGGAFEQRGLAEIGRQKVRGVGQETQQLISSGLYGTTTMAGVGRRWEAEVGAPARMTLESMMEQRTTAAQQAKAGFIERREDEYPDYGMLAQLASRVGTAGSAPKYRGAWG